MQPTDLTETQWQYMQKVLLPQEIKQKHDGKKTKRHQIREISIILIRRIFKAP